VEINFRSILEIILLVLFATVHGYIGAWLAVRMLFRPRYPFKLLGITLFPQGMIPRHRDRLAQAIGRAVGGELVSEETIIQELFDKGFLKKRINAVVQEYYQTLFSSEVPSVIEIMPPKVREPLLDAIFSLQIKISHYVSESLKSPEVTKSVNDFVSKNVDILLSKRLSETFKDEEFRLLVEFSSERIHNSLRNPYFERKVKEFVSKQINEILTSNLCLEEILTPESIELIKNKAAEQVKPVIHQLAEIATADKTRRKIASIIKKEVNNYYENLPFFKKIFVSRENLLKEVDNLVNESLPKRIEETLNDDSFAAEAKTFFITSIEAAIKRPLRDLLGNISEENLKSIHEQASKSILRLLQSDEMRLAISNYLREMIAKVKPHSLDAILRVTHTESKDLLKRQLSRTLLSVMSNEQVHFIVGGLVSEQIEKLLSQPIGKMSDYLSESKIKLLLDSLSEAILDAARQRLPSIIKEFNVGEIVKQKINAYPVEKLEELVLSVAKEHLRTIELFGALFGFIIGLFQAILSYLFFAKK